jgi:RNA polymerase sigma factor (sigma-70 family)
MNTYNKTGCGKTALLQLINLNDNSSFDILYKKYWKMLLNFAHQYISDSETCKEIVQELFIVLYLKRNKLTINKSLPSYLLRSLRNKILNHLRTESVYKKHLALAGQSHLTVVAVNEAELWMDVYDLEKQIIYCLNKMPLKYREVYILNRQNAYTVKETAEMLQRPVDTVERQIRIAVRLMQEHLNSYKIRIQ